MRQSLNVSKEHFQLFHETLSAILWNSSNHSKDSSSHSREDFFWLL